MYLFYFYPRHLSNFLYFCKNLIFLLVLHTLQVQARLLSFIVFIKVFLRIMGQPLQGRNRLSHLF